MIYLNYIIVSCLAITSVTSSSIASFKGSDLYGSNVPRIPLYAGVSYDLLKGNPLANTIDPGFGYQVFEHTYDMGLTTEDGLFYIPDHTVSRIRSSCSYESMANEYTGTEGYQKTLNVFVSAEGSGFGQSFSASVDYKRTESNTRTKTSVIVQSGASCEVFSLEIPVYQSLRVTDDFRQAVLRAFYNNHSSWASFMNIYGTHFVGQVVLGGRIVMQSKMSSESYAELLSVGIDIKAEAKLSFLASLTVSTSISSQTTSQKEFTKKVTETATVNVGGKPPQSGNWMDWQAMLKESPAPIKYTLVSTPTLFTTQNFPMLSERDLVFLQDSYVNYLTNKYCAQVDCSPPGIDPALPTWSQKYSLLWTDNVSTGCTFPNNKTNNAGITISDDNRVFAVFFIFAF